MLFRPAIRIASYGTNNSHSGSTAHYDERGRFIRIRGQNGVKKKKKEKETDAVQEN